MSDQRIFTRYRADEIKAEFQNVEVKKFKSNAMKRKNALRKIIANLTMGNLNEMSYLFPEIINYWKIEDDIEVRRICHEYIRKLGPSKPKNANDALPYILKDLDNRNPALQIMAIKTLLMVPSPDYVDEAFRFVSGIINRRSSSSDVLKTSIFALTQLDDINHDRALPLLDSLRDIISGDHQINSVKVAALNTLYTIHEKNLSLPNLNLTVDASYDLLTILPKLNEWDKALLLESLICVCVPQTHNDAYDLIDMVEPQLQHVNTYVALNALKFIIYITNYVDHISDNLSKKLSSSIIALLNKPPELQFLVLRNVILLLLSRESLILNLDVSYFFVEYNDPIYIKDTKLECLYLLANKDNLHNILEELEQYATDIDIQMSRKAIRAIGNLAVKLDENSADECVNTLLNLLEFGVDYVVEEIISVFRNILRKYQDQYKSQISTLVSYTDSIHESDSKNAMIWIITNYADILPEYLEYFRVFSSHILEETLEVQFSILNSSVKFFARNISKETEALCIEILKCCTEEIDNPDLRDRAFMYWRLLSLLQSPKSEINVEVIKDIVDGELPLIELNTKLDPAILEELELNIGSIASIYLKPVSQIFKQIKTKQLPSSSVLNQNRDSINIVSNENLIHEQKRSQTDRFSDINHYSEGRSIPSKPSRRNTIMDDYDKPAETVNQLKGKMRSSNSSSSLLSRKPTKLMRKLTIKKPF
ncbi:hypothetical protein Kpol_344p2 [Vanderwaltozyma polyspora DSM 70294]|uniref:AP complex subunit beta n=1 Tax=Vanderwaltozyma polyspora (strain ATCC 22028 / DSM 70294 / BCRC 21397 / CBS 2163 / NBRC 10782 / NRRL Y-8283 / UCD 57-17) TaxID=436907 RepID=A7TSR8_VANPO|nr:uncharacterized protein Kpol_344p2 [Vanderwaltozyma polyspora DSM 70294]EDO14682.1 hypothetical protein Kpol_344p2 [Vanderwaltozyma polyspora DSM 70294]